MKIISRTVTLAIVVSLLAGCGDKSNQEISTTQTTDSTMNTEERSNSAEENNVTSEFVDYSKGFTENVSIEIPVYDRAYEGWDVSNNYYTQWIQENFGDKYNITVEFVAIDRTAEVQDYTQMLAAGTAPNIIFHYDMPQALIYYDTGAMQELNLEEMNYYAPTYFANMGETIQEYGSIDGKQTFFFAKRSDAYNYVTLIRQDWLDQVNMEMPHNHNEYIEVLKAWKDAGLGYGGANLIQNYFNYDYGYRTWPIDEKERALYSDISIAGLTWEPSYQWLKTLNYEYNAGLIDPEFYLNTDDNAQKAKFVSGKSGIYGMYLSANTDVISGLLANDSNAKVSVLDPAYISSDGNLQSRAYWPFGIIMGIESTTTEEQRVAIWLYLEWMSQPDNLFFLQNGIEGKNYTKDADGIAVANADFGGESKLSPNKNKDYWCMVTESAEYSDSELNYKANLVNWAPKGYEYLIEDAYNYYNDYKEYCTADVLFSIYIDSIAEYKTTLNDLWKELYVKCVIAKEEDFEALYQQACKQYLEAGYQEILDEKQKAIDAGEYK